MKEKYVKPVMELVEFEVEDIICTSGDDDESPVNLFDEEADEINR
ncbi:hypothetical protein [Coprococcus catus]|nr:hypothetical protein [Coprococcus catus]